MIIKISQLILINSLFFLFSCAQSKSSETVFPTQVAKGCEAKAIKNKYIVGWEDGRFTIEKDISDEQFRENFVNPNLQKIRYVDRDSRIQIRPFLSKQNTDVEINASETQWQVDRVSARSIWNQGFKGQNVIVGVVDGMVDVNHIQLKNNIAYFKQFNLEQNNPSKNIHGTHVSGIIAADPLSGVAVGIAPSAKIAGGQFIDNDGYGSIGDAILAMNAVAAEGAKIINFSWGGAPCVENLKTAVNNLSDQGILVVTAAGNESTFSDQSPTYPAAFMFLNQINVAATNMDDTLSFFSNFGEQTVHLAAPGNAIYSTIPGNRVQPLDGTSMSAPVVSGSAALLLSAVPRSSAQQLKSALMSTVDVPFPGLKIQSRGRVNLENALIKLKQLVLN